MTGCQGELVEETVHVYIENEAGEAIVDEEMATMQNGFIDLWLPREQTFTVRITTEDKQVEQQISTYANDATCVTTMQLR